MAKNDWLSGEVGTQDMMNQPFWLVSGTKSGNDLLLYLTPGSIRLPGINQVLFSGQPTLTTIANAQADKYLTLFVRPNYAGTSAPNGLISVVVSGNATGTVPGPPFHDAYYIGQVYTGASFASENLRGPWTTTSGTFERWDQRGQMAGTFRPRAVYKQLKGASLADSVVTFNAATLSTSSGVIFLNMRYKPNSWEQPLIAATITYSVSGNGAGTQVGMSYGVAVVNNSTGAATTEWQAVDSAKIFDGANFDLGNAGSVPHTKTTSFTVVGTQHATNLNQSYRLFVGPLDAYSDDNSGDGIFVRIHQVSLTVMPGYYASDGTERDS